MQCSECDGATKVTYHKKQITGTVKRTRQCAVCGHKFITVDDGDGEMYLGEAAALEAEELAMVTKNYYQIVDTLSRANLTPIQWSALDAVLARVKMRQNIQGGKAGLRRHRFDFAATKN